MHQTENDRSHATGRQNSSSDVEADAPVRRRLRQHNGARDDQCYPDRNVDGEDHPPPPSEVVGIDQPASHDRTRDAAQCQDRPRQTERHSDLLRRETLLDQPQSLGNHQRPNQSLHDPHRDEHLRRHRESSQERGEREAGDPDQEHALATEHIAQPRADQKPRGHRKRVPGGEPLNELITATQVTDDRRTSNRRHQRIQKIQEIPQENDGNYRPRQPRPHRTRRRFHLNHFHS